MAKKKQKKENVKYMTVTYNNDFNNVINKDVNVTDLNFMYGIIGTIKNSDSNEIELGYDYVKALSGRPQDERPIHTFNFINNFMSKMDNTVKLQESDNRGPYRLVSFPLFKLTDNNKSSLKFKLSVNDAFDIKSIIQELDSSFTRIDFETYLELNSKYSKALYRLLMQFCSTGTYRVDLDKLRILLCVPENMENKRLMQRIINPSIKEINEKSDVIFDLSVSKKTNSKKQIESLSFFFNADSSKFKKTKKIILEEIEEEKQEAKEKDELYDILKNNS